MTEATHETHHGDYVKIWAILVGLLTVSVIGPMFEIQIITLITAFGIAIVKAFLVLKHFMHIGHTPRFVPYLCATCLVFMLLFFAAVAPDVMNDTGSGWEKPDWVAEEAEWADGGPAAAEHHE